MGRNKRQNEAEEVVEPTLEEAEETEEVVEPTLEEAEEAEEVVEPTLDEPIIEEVVSEIKGKVIPLKLFVRSEPSKESEPLTIIKHDTDVTINNSFVDSQFYKVTLADGLEGYCVKEFIKIVE